MSEKQYREIPFNYTSADDSRIVRHLLGENAWYHMEKLRFQRKTGRLARLLFRFLGDMFILHRNPFIYHNLVSSVKHRKPFFRAVRNDIDTVSRNAANSPELVDIVDRFRNYLDTVEREITAAARKRSGIRKSLGTIIGVENIFFDPFTLNSHATDATDWRLYLPVAVVRPTSEKQISRLLKAIVKLGLYVIPRGAGTGLTGGAVPVCDGCVIINTEKLNHNHGIVWKDFRGDNGVLQRLPVIRVDAGVITGEAMRYAANRNLVFATDPTSSWACTIGGNIAENAGGKSAVLWGTAIDNLVSYRIVMPDGRLLKVERNAHPARKILEEDKVVFSISEDGKEKVETVVLSGTEIRKKGLGKDITNKALNGLPGVQKEGTDGIITSADFILYPEYPYKKTCCLEFFGQDMEEAGRVIPAIAREFTNRGEEALMALEHFDEEYVRAIDYKVKTPRGDLPKAVLLIDIVAHRKAHVLRGIKRLKGLTDAYPDTHLFVARNPTEAERYWRDRKRLGAIARRTNAFKLNEDIVLPLDTLAEFSHFIDQYNVEEERHNQLAFVWQASDYLEKAKPLEDPSWLAAKQPTAKKLLLKTLQQLQLAGRRHLREQTHTRSLLNDLLELLSGYSKVSGELKSIYQDIRSRLIVVATHMHAGDGNVHVNIPVFSNDREMMIRAQETADAVMQKTIAMGGVVSGEHGIGFTKFTYLDLSRQEALREYRHKIDPAGIFNPGKLSDPQVPEKVFTPSFNLLGLEARILKHGAIEKLAAKISTCVRCGKCKQNCCVFYPEENLFFHPRNKNLAIAALIEAILYETQRFKSTRFSALKYMEEIADHCTICHKCAAPCPVGIDTGEVSILEREILKNRNLKHLPLSTRASLLYLESRDRLFNHIFRNIAIKAGTGLQRAAWRVRKALPSAAVPSSGRTVDLLRSPFPRIPAASLRKILPRCEDNQVLIIHPQRETGSTVFYFPGCGSERIFSQAGMASLYILLATGTQVVLPPPFVCCGFPAKVNASGRSHSRQVLRDTVIFSQVREMFGHIDFASVVLSCGTCMEALREMEADTIFGCSLRDVSHFALSRGLSAKLPPNRYYHVPCHDSMNGKGAALISSLGAGDITTIPNCCAEAGTLALSRPKISNAMRAKKQAAVQNAVPETVARPVVITNCPSCLQGLARITKPAVTPRHLVEELARCHGGNSWKQDLVSALRRTETITF